MNLDELRQHIFDVAVVPILMVDNSDVDAAVAMVDVLVGAGATVIEVLFRNPNAPAALAEIKRRHPNMLLAAGTILDASGTSQAEDAKADFMVSPGFSPVLHAAAQAARIPLVPGVNTASEVQHARELGYLVQKFYPCWDQGHQRLPEFAAIYPEVGFLVTGSVTSDTVGEFAHHGNVAAVGGAWMSKSAATAAGPASDIEMFRAAR